jgi:threonylcarbamoyladenosine tRNA methylthiotransferase MtaB
MTKRLLTYIIVISSFRHIVTTYKLKICLKMTGCKNNYYELEKILEWAVKHGVSVVPEEDADYCIINTCTVTQTADKKSRQMIRRTKNSNKKIKTIVFGCAARIQKEEFKKMTEIDYLFSNLDEVISFLSSQISSCNVRLRRAEAATPSHSRALVQIQDGCDNFCSYCIIAAARGRSKNRPKDEIIDEINKRVSQGYNEVILTGINVGAYGASTTKKPEESHLPELLEEIMKRTKVPRIRLSSMGPEYFNERLYKILKNPRICRHIHLSIQSCSDSVLARMRRNYSAKDVETIVRRLKKDIPGIAITTDIIVGFPEEAEKEFKETLDFVKNNPLAKAHVFPYSARDNTAAAKMKQVPDKTKKERSAKLQKLADKQRADFIKGQIGEKAWVIWGGKNEGITDNYIRVIKKFGDKRKAMDMEVLSKENVICDSIV